jgi:DNA polymerase-3 subunit beta
MIDILQKLPADQVVTLTANASKLTLQGGKSRFTLQTLPARKTSRWCKRPPTSGRSSSACRSEDAEDLLISQVHFAMAQQDIRYYLNGLLFVAEGGDADAGRHRRPPPGAVVQAHARRTTCPSRK